MNLRSSVTMERMTARTILEARSVRVIAVVTMLFLPPTFISVGQVNVIIAEIMESDLIKGFLDMDYITVTKEEGHWETDTKPGLVLYLAITIPLVVFVVAGWLFWDWLSNRRVRTTRESDA
jgi:hypothetical protein